MAFIIKVSTEKELFVIHTKTSTDIESINGVPSESLIPGPVCLKERLTFNLMTYGTREPQSFVVGGSVIRQKGHVLNVLAAEENSMSSYKVTFVKTGMKTSSLNRHFYLTSHEFCGVKRTAVLFSALICNMSQIMCGSRRGGADPPPFAKFKFL